MFEAYKIGVRVTLINDVSRGLGMMAGQFATTEAAAAKLHDRMVKLNALAVKGAMIGGVGAAGLALLKGPYEEAKKLFQAQTDFRTLNLSAMDNSAVFAKAANTAHEVLGTTITGNVKAIQDLHTAFGDLHHALDMTKNFQMFATAAEMKTGGPVEGLIYSAAKALEHRGGRLTTNPEEFNREMDMMSRVFFGSSGKVAPSDYFSASQTGKMTYKLYSPEFLYGPYASYIQEKTGSTAGTAGMTAFSALVGGHMDNKAKSFLAEIGLYQEGISDKRSKIIQDALKLAGIKKGDKDYTAMAPLVGSIKDQYLEMFASNPDKFVNDVMVPAIQKRYGKDANIPLLLASRFNRNTGDFLGDWYVNKQKNDKDAAIFQHSSGFRDAYGQYLKSPQGAEEAANAAWKNFLAVFGSVYLPQITKGLLWLASALDKLGVFVERHKDGVGMAVKAFAGIFGVMTVTGVAVLAKFALNISGLVPLLKTVGVATGNIIPGMTALGGAIATIANGLASAGLVGAAGYGFGTILNNTLLKDRSAEGGTSFGAALYDWAHMSGPNQKPGVNTVKPRPGFMTPQVQTINMDGRKVGEIVSGHQAKAASRPQSGSSTFDPTMMSAFPSMGLVR